MKVLGLVNCYSLGYTLVNCYALGLMSQYFILIFRISTMFDIIPLELVRFRNSQYFRKFVFVFMSGLPLSLSFSYSNVEVENSEEVFQPFSSLAGTISPQIAK